MSDLFELPESPLPPLEAARRRLEAAERAYEEEKSEATDDEVYWEKVALSILEQEALRK